MPKIRVGWVGLVWDTMARQTRAKKWHHICSIIRAVQNYTYTKRSSRAFEVSSCWDPRERELCIEGTFQNVSGFWVQYTQYFVHCTKKKRKHAYISVAQKHQGTQRLGTRTQAHSRLNHKMIGHAVVHTLSRNLVTSAYCTQHLCCSLQRKHCALSHTANMSIPFT